MSITGKSSLSIKKQDLAGQKTGATSFRKITFAHKAGTGENGISLSSLSTPSELLTAGFSQPSPTLLASANLKFFRDNLTIVSSVRGVLQDYLSYVVTSSTYIAFTESFGTSLEGEIFTGTIDAVPRNDLAGIDTTSILASGTLPANQVQFNVGSAFKVNANPSTQIGEIAVYLDGILQFRNSGNVEADINADGNYQEIDNGSGYGTLIEFNQVDTFTARAVMVIGTGVNVIRPNGSLVQELELLAGQIDAMIPTLADAAGVPESTFQAAPNNADLKAFGDRVLVAEQNIDTLESLPSNQSTFYEEWTGTVTLTGGYVSNPTGPAWIVKVGTLVTMYVHDNIIGTSNATTNVNFTFSNSGNNIPTRFAPITAQFFSSNTTVFNNSTFVATGSYSANSSTLILYTNNGSGNSFTASGTKGAYHTMFMWHIR